MNYLEVKYAQDLSFNTTSGKIPDDVFGYKLMN